MKMRPTDRKSGFTVVELMVAMLATAILSLVAGLMLVYGWMGWHKNFSAVQMQRDTTLAMRVIAKEIRRTPIEKITDGTSLTCINTNGAYTFSTSGGDLNLEKDAGTPWPLVRDAGAAIRASKEVDAKGNLTGSVTVVLTLDTGTDSCISTNIVYSRN